MRIRWITKDDDDEIMMLCGCTGVADGYHDG